MFYCEFSEISKNTFFTEQRRTTTSEGFQIRFVDFSDMVVKNWHCIKCDKTVTYRNSFSGKHNFLCFLA